MPSKPLFGTDAIRKLAKERVEATSLRAVASEIPMSKSGLDSFLRGRSPYSKTRPKLAAWYLRNRGSAGSPVRPQELDAAIAVIVSFITQDERSDVRRERLRRLVARLDAAADP